MPSINPHINFNGNAEEAFTFYKSVFGGEFAKVMRLKDLAGPNFPVSEKDKNKILFIALPIGKNNVLKQLSESSPRNLGYDVIWSPSKQVCLERRQKDFLPGLKRHTIVHAHS